MIPAERMRTTRQEDVAAVIDRDLPWQKLAGSTVFVTGGGGFLGGYLVRTLLALNASRTLDHEVRVTVLVRNAVKARANLIDVLDDPHLELREADLSAITKVDAANCNYVIHAASQASPRFYGSDPVGTLLPNAVGTAALLEALKASADPRGMLFISSSEVYGEVPRNQCLNETAYGSLDPTDIRACYAEGKRFGEALCAAWYQQYRIPTYIVRPFHTYGPGLQEDDGRVFADFSFNVIRGESIVMTSDGGARRAFCYVSDAIAGFFTVLLTGQPATPYNVANTSGELSVFELAQLLVKLYPEKKLSVERRGSVAPAARSGRTSSHILPDTSRLAALGWRANVDPESGFRRMIDAYEGFCRSA